ncbi:extracellular solute-binding protein [Paenibacillus sp. GCM10012303]|uniref:extracellular solute-binding protein n=1 Tax=Paenibacillus sp. GCM10012303 TaxID=3317340 RepID=UPI0036D436D9
MNSKPSRRTFRDRMNEMIATLRRDIESGVYAPGSFLPSEERLAEQFEVSYKSVAKALDQLAAEGLLVKIRRVGSKVVKKETVHFGFHDTMYRDVDLASLLALFHQEHPHIEIRPVAISQNYASDTIDDLMTSGRFDVMMTNHIYYQHARERNRLNVLEPVRLADDTYPFLREELLVDGVSYALPLVFSPVILAYNPEHFREAGLPEPDSGWTWERMLEAAAQLTKPEGRYGFAASFLAGNNRWPAIWMQLASDPLHSSGWRPEAEELAVALTYCCGLMKADGVVPSFLDVSTMQSLFAEGKLSMLMTTYFLLNGLGDKIPYDIAPLPYVTKPRTMLLWIGLAIYRKTAVPEAARTFVEFMSSPEAQAVIRRNTLSIPGSAVAAGASEPKVHKPERYNLYREIIPTYRSHRQYGLSHETIEAVRELLPLLYSGLIGAAELRVRLAELLDQQEAGRIASGG